MHCLCFNTATVGAFNDQSVRLANQVFSGAAGAYVLARQHAGDVRDAALAGNADEAAKIATVIYNRLGKGWALGIDATSKYLAELDGSAIDFDSTSPYNTRRQQGLPPTPIAAPGDYALDAAFRPAAGPWMYYVLTDPGSHTFVVTDAEFAAAKQVCIVKGLGCG